MDSERLFNAVAMAVVVLVPLGAVAVAVVLFCRSLVKLLGDLTDNIGGFLRSSERRAGSEQRGLERVVEKLLFSNNAAMLTRHAQERAAEAGDQQTTEQDAIRAGAPGAGESPDDDMVPVKDPGHAVG